MAGLFDRFAPLMAQRTTLFGDNGVDPFSVKMEELISPTEAMINGKRTILAGTNNYLGLTFAPEALKAAHEALEACGTGTTGSRVANGTYYGHKQLEDALCEFFDMEHAMVFSTGFLANLGRPVRESACECERNSDIGLGNVMALLSGPAVSDAIQDPKNDLAKLVAAQPDDRLLINDVFVRILNRAATPAETASTLAAWRSLDTDHHELNAARNAREAWWVPMQIGRAHV